MSRWLIAVFGVMMLGARSPVMPDDFGDCLSDRPDISIPACSNLINSGKLEGDNLSKGYQFRGIAYSFKGNYDRAIADLDRALEINPDDADTYTGRGLMHGQKGDYDRAISDLDRAIEINPEDSIAYYGRGRAYAEKGDFDHAISDFASAIEIDPDDADSYIGRGLSYGQKGDFDHAIADFDMNSP